MQPFKTQGHNLSDEQISSEQPKLQKVLIADSDKVLTQRLAHLWEKYGAYVDVVQSAVDAMAAAKKFRPDAAIIESRIPDGGGLNLIEKLRQINDSMRVVVVTGEASIAGAVAAVKAGANDYIPKPADPTTIVAAVLGEEKNKSTKLESPMSADRIRWEHIQRVFQQCGRNVSETARQLGMHRRTLQRILAKRAPR